jgi:hypothetical protein
MPPKPATPPEDMQTRHEHGVRLETTVRGLLHHRAVRRAHRIFDQEWELTVLPQLPLRHPFEIERLDNQGMRMLLERDAANEAVSLHLKRGVDRRMPAAVAVVASSESKEEAIGFLSAEAQAVLERAGDYAELYSVKPLQLTGIGTGNLQFQMELVRPDLRQCSSCGALHADEHVNCEECRKKRRRKQKTLEETAEVAPVAMQSAFRALSQEGQSLEDTL